MWGAIHPDDQGFPQDAKISPQRYARFFNPCKTSLVRQYAHGAEFVPGVRGSFNGYQRRKLSISQRREGARPGDVIGYPVRNDSEPMQSA